MDNIIEEFEQLARYSSLLCERSTTGNSVCVHFTGPGGTAEVQFEGDQILGVIDGDIFHHWQMFPSIADMRAGIRKIREFIG